MSFSEDIRKIRHRALLTQEDFAKEIGVSSAYDETGNKELLKAVIKLTKWLHTENPDDYYHLLNWYQAMYRKDKKDKRIDHNRLCIIMDKADADALKIGAAIVAGEQEKAKELLAAMQNEKREEFLQFPIANLLS